MRGLLSAAGVHRLLQPLGLFKYALPDVGTDRYPRVKARIPVDCRPMPLVFFFILAHF